MARKAAKRGKRTAKRKAPAKRKSAGRTRRPAKSAARKKPAKTTKRKIAARKRRAPGKRAWVPKWPPEGFEVCGPGCPPPARRDGDIWCVNTQTCQNRGADCGCNLFKRRRQQGAEWEHAAEPNTKVREEDGYDYRCSCVKRV